MTKQVLAVQSLRTELRDVHEHLAGAEQRWKRLDDDAADFAQRPSLAEEVTRLRQRAAQLPTLIAWAERQNAAVTELRKHAQEVNAAVTLATREFIARLPDRGDLLSIATLSAQAQTLAHLVAQYDGDTGPTPIPAVRQLARAVHKLASDLDIVLRSGEARADLSAYQEQIAILRTGAPI